MEQVINPSPTKYLLIALGPQNMLAEGDVVEPAFLNTLPYAGSTKTIQTPTWFYWIDDEPDAGFVHSTRFVYIDASHSNPTVGDGIEIEIQGWWPKINGTKTYDYPPGNSHPDLVYGTVPFP